MTYRVVETDSGWALCRQDGGILIWVAWLTEAEAKRFVQ